MNERRLWMVALLAISVAHLGAHAQAIQGRDVFAIAVARDGTVYAGMDGGILRSKDRGASWTGTDRGFPQTLVMYPALTSMVVATDGKVYAFVEDSVLRSADQGTTWQRCMRLGKPEDVGSVKLLATGHGLHAATAAGIFRSTDHCANWTVGDREIWADALAVGPDGVMYAGGGNRNGSLVSTDHGVVWKGTPPSKLNESGVRSLAVGSDGTVYAGVDGDGIFKSSDRAASWRPANQGLPRLSTVTSILATPNAVYLTGASAVYKSVDKGASWKLSSRGLEQCGAYIWAIAQAPDGALYAGCRNGIFKSTDDANTWTASLTLDTRERP